MVTEKVTVNKSCVADDDLASQMAWYLSMSNDIPHLLLHQMPVYPAIEKGVQLDSLMN
ncbi:hypothetical protein DAPPUDRAFT_322489 [Daphnia pulex]|uniref:Uncharacterized protein n=1 Tax=Daphnia pulex TaxID=6669 RepID=E9GW61_DAPPU|nr:hypothetical protein DAPPUDRAFT_322489 [Daphnia pulex]|eukprot:EFX76324.1 hypothetical protein DAPPUDRAFT_322489 [Daphnia pulex]